MTDTSRNFTTAQKHLFFLQSPGRARVGWAGPRIENPGSFMKWPQMRWHPAVKGDLVARCSDIVNNTVLTVQDIWSSWWNRNQWLSHFATVSSAQTLWYEKSPSNRVHPAVWFLVPSSRRPSKLNTGNDLIQQGSPLSFSFFLTADYLFRRVAKPFFLISASAQGQR